MGGFECNSKFLLFLVAAVFAAAVVLAGCVRPAEDDLMDSVPALKMESLEVRLNGDGDNLIDFVKTTRDYIYEISATGNINIEDNFITIDGAAMEGEGEIEFYPSSKQIDLPITVAKTFAVYPKGDAKAPAYSVVIMPGYNGSDTDYHSMYLSVRYTDGANLIPDFNASHQDYSINIAAGGRRDLVVEARSASDRAQVKISYDGQDSGYANKSNIATIAGASLPSTGHKSIVVSVMSEKETYMEYRVLLNAPDSDMKTYEGTITGAINGYNITGLAVRTVDGTDAQAARLGTDDPSNWTLVVGGSWQPYGFVVELEKDGVSYKSAVIVPPAVMEKGTTVTVANVGKVIASVKDMQSVNKDDNTRSGAYVLGQDLNLKEVEWGVGNYAIANFTGKFYGNGYTVNDLVLSNDSKATGFFNSVKGNAYIENFTVIVSSAENLTITGMGAFYFGGVVGLADGGTGRIKGVTVKGDLSVGDVPEARALLLGGFIGEVASGQIKIENCVSEVNVYVNSTNAATTAANFYAVGGFIGKSAHGAHPNGSTIENCYATGDINITLSANRPVFAGGFAGILQNGTNALTNCYATGKVSVWNKAATINQVYKNGTLAAGGLVGYTSNEGTAHTLTNCAALGEKAVAVYGTLSTPANYGAGRLVGLSNKGVYYNNAALKGMSTGNTLEGTADNSEGGANDVAGTGKTNADFHNPAAWGASGLAFNTDIWDFSTIEENGYPILKN